MEYGSSGEWLVCSYLGFDISESAMFVVEWSMVAPDSGWFVHAQALKFLRARSLC